MPWTLDVFDDTVQTKDLHPGPLMQATGGIAATRTEHASDIAVCH